MNVPKKGAIVPNMGIIESTQTSLGEVLFSKTQRQVLALLFGNPQQSYYANEIVRFAGVGIGSVQRELEKLAQAGLLTITYIGNQKHYQANKQAPIFEELRGIVLKTFGLADVLRTALTPFTDKINVAFIYGSVAKSSDTANSDIDVMMIGDLSYAEVLSELARSETVIGRQINPTIYKTEDFKRKVAEDNAFLNRILEQPKIVLMGSLEEIEK